MRRTALFALGIALACSASAGDFSRIFVTSVKGNGNLSTWPDAHGLTGLQAADEICSTRAAEALIPEPDQYVALLSDLQDDAYCRWHGRTGKRDTNCNLISLPTGAGPWYRMDGLAAMDVSQNATGPYPDGGYVPRAVFYDEFGAILPSSVFSESLYFSATWPDGRLDASTSETCNDWTSDTGHLFLGTAFFGFGGVNAAGWTCDKNLRLMCMKSGENGIPLKRYRAPSARQAFMTTGTGNGNLSTWADAGGASSLEAADNICRAHAQRAGAPLPNSFKAWLSTSLVNAIDRFEFDGPIYRRDGVRVVASIEQLTSSVLESPIQVDENGRVDWGMDVVWTGTRPNGIGDPLNCNGWTLGSGGGGVFGQNWAANTTWTTFNGSPAAGCSNNDIHLYCFGDNDSLFLQSFE